ncbi:hypothetical protein FB45DRAFT_843137 [Roridomyces roridus]|uniref:Uncharacterized protein n=1 Tax=Roridomyces roridus TaxID=1738132 RepID=A0AAD7B7X9_9AGAR|nr:hypothetical protein FB45DRAFT_843137 [Roridomyces roridus]
MQNALQSCLSAALVNVLRCLPADSFELRRTKNGSMETRVMHLLRPLRESDLERVLFYTGYVKYLCSDAFYHDISALFPVVSGWLSENTLPKLRALGWFHTEIDVQHIYPFLTPKLTEISVSVASGGALTLLSTLPRRCPHLKDVRLLLSRNSDNRDPQAVQAVSAFVRELHDLEVLSLDPEIDGAALAHLAVVSSIRDLCLEQITSSPLSPNSRPTFQSLQTLSFAEAEIHSPINFLAWCKNTPLKDFAAECLASPSAEDVHRLFLAVAGAITHSSLGHFLLNFDGDPSTPPDPTSLIAFNSFRHLFSFRNLVSVSMESTVGIDLDDAAVLEMARSWPRIETLQLDSYRGTSHPRTTLRCLEAFPQYCHHLTKLCIAFDATVVPASQNLTLDSLEVLDVEASPITIAEPVAEFLAGLFPNLVELKTLAEDYDAEDLFLSAAYGYSDLWKEVASLL